MPHPKAMAAYAAGRWGRGSRAAPTPDAVNSRTTWLSTINEDGSPHVTAVGGLWLDGTFWFQTGAGTWKGRNVARDPRCSIAVSIRGADVVLEGDAARVTEPDALVGASVIGCAIRTSP
jgi:Pyridoxamine 5'-phosphate oxidase